MTLEESRKMIGLTQTELARRLGVQKPAVSRWESGARRIPAERAVQIELVTEGKIPRHITRPDLFSEQPVSPERAEALRFGIG